VTRRNTTTAPGGCRCRALTAPDIAELEGRNHMDLNVVDADPPFRADCIPGELPVEGDGIKTVHDRVTMSAVTS
jgi:hypothetical protein